MTSPKQSLPFAPGVSFSAPTTRNFLPCWIAGVLSPASRLPSFDRPDSAEESVELLPLHWQLSFFHIDYAVNILIPKVGADGVPQTLFLPTDMSNTERGRFLRALCRLYTIANIFIPAYVPDNVWQLLAASFRSSAHQVAAFAH